MLQLSLSSRLVHSSMRFLLLLVLGGEGAVVVKVGGLAGLFVLAGDILLDESLHLLAFAWLAVGLLDDSQLLLNAGVLAVEVLVELEPILEVIVHRALMSPTAVHERVGGAREALARRYGGREERTGELRPSTYFLVKEWRAARWGWLWGGLEIVQTTGYTGSRARLGTRRRGQVQRVEASLGGDLRAGTGKGGRETGVPGTA
mmetsp:Transcript_11065/g.18514  ORF Transcript_11065/g.18514 Transcript_11065/m.18514 type:complete len:203 (-) Transcript_11065:43-651(-)